MVETIPPANPVSTFTSATGAEWHPVLTALALVKICRAGDLTISKITSMDVNVADLVEALWFACEDEAKGRGVTREVFLTKHVGISEMQPAIQSLFASVQKAFPDLYKTAPDIIGSGTGVVTGAGAGETQRPFVPGS